MRSAGLIVMATLGGCMSALQPSNDVTTDAVAQLSDAGGVARGTVSITPRGDGLRLTVDGIGLPSGAHGLHVHTVGRCDAPDFMTAGAHWNPSMRQHGRDNPVGPHRGDLPNLLIGTDGRGSVSFDLPDSPGALFDEDGAAVVVHAAPDDYKTDPSGNSGARIACGVLTPR